MEIIWNIMAWFAFILAITGAIIILYVLCVGLFYRSNAEKEAQKYLDKHGFTGGRAKMWWG